MSSQLWARERGFRVRGQSCNSQPHRGSPEIAGKIFGELEPGAGVNGHSSAVNTSPRSLRVLRLLLILGSAVVAMRILPAAVHASTRAETLEAIRAVENPRNLARPGKFGELGAYQFRRATWRMHTDLPFERAVDRAVAEEVAVQHYEWLRRGLLRNGLPATPYNIALAWNSGLSAVVRGRASAAAHNYAERVNNLVLDGRARLTAAR